MYTLNISYLVFTEDLVNENIQFVFEMFRENGECYSTFGCFRNMIFQQDFYLNVEK